jgi:formate hydrogenlyase transcriptional activator
MPEKDGRGRPPFNLHATSVRSCLKLITFGSFILPSGELKASKDVATDGIETLEAAERNHIERALWETNWVIGGPAGAATRLGMTLQSKMRKPGISRPQ